MEWMMIIGLIVFGIILIIVEIIFVPGTTIVGIGGFLCAGYGVLLTYQEFGSSTGTITLMVTLGISVGTLIYSLKTNAWERFSLKDTNTGKFNDDYKPSLKVGDTGETLSSLKPFGKAIFSDKEFEVRSTGAYVSERQSVRVIKIDERKIIVEPITNS